MSYIVDSREISPEVEETNRQLQEFIKKQSAHIKIIGIGGAGNNSISRMKEIGIKGGEIIAINTDAQDLLYTSADRKILIGKQLTKGNGAGSNPQIGMEAARESQQEIQEKISDSDLIFITCGLGGGTGTGAAPIVAEIARKQKALTIGVVTLPFTVEGKKRNDNALEGLEKLALLVDTLIVIPNDKLLEIAPNLPISTAFKIADEILTNAIKGITELITKSGLVNLDFADVKAVMSDGGLSLIGMGESNSTNRSVEAIERALNNPLLDVEIKDATGALVNVMGGEDLSLEEYKEVMEYLGNRLSPEAKIISGAQIAKEFEGMLKVMVVVTGIQGPIFSEILPEKFLSESNEDEDNNEISEYLDFEKGEFENTNFKKRMAG